MKTSDFKKLEVWQKSMDLCVDVYEAIKSFPIEERYSLCDQIRRCVTSVPSNIAEGQGKSSKKEFRYHLFVARGSLAELQTQLILSKMLKYKTEEEITPLIEKISIIDRMLVKLISFLDSSTTENR